MGFRFETRHLPVLGAAAIGAALLAALLLDGVTAGAQTATPTASPTATPTASPTGTATATPTASPTPTATVPAGGQFVGTVPTSGFGLVTFGGTVAELDGALTGAGCDRVWATSSGSFIVYVPSSAVAAVNAPFLALWSDGAIPPNTPVLLGNC
jgi:hypothetical protein